MKFLLIILCLFMFFLSYYHYGRKKMVFSPASIFNIVWLFLIFFYLLFDDEEYSYVGICWLLFGLLLVNVGQYCTTIGFASTKDHFFKKPTIGHENNLKSLVLYLSFLLIIVTGVNYIRSGGIKNVADVAYDYYSNGNVSNSLSQSLIIQIQTFALYINGFIGGRLFKTTKKAHYKLLSFFVFIPPAIMLLTTSGKLGLVLVVMTFFIGYIIETIDFGEDFNKKSFFRLLRKYWPLLFLVFFLFVFSLTLRMGSSSRDMFLIAFHKMKSYAFGSPAAFNAWFSSNDGFEYGLGTNTFLGILHTLGIAERPMGVYNEMVTTRVWSTNVYTAFRPIIEDFGYFGGLVFLFLLGCVFGKSYKCYLKHKKWFSFLILCNSYLFVFFSSFNSPFVYLNLSVLFILYLVFEFLLFNYRANKKRKEIRNRERNYSSRGQWNPSLSTNNSNE